jgi:hypothetical protein
LLSTPRGTNYFFELFRRGQRGRDPAFQSWQSPTWANPHLDPELIEGERSRLSREAFEQEYAARFLGEGLVEHCEACGGPVSGMLPVLVLRGDDQPKCCAECGLYVFEDGRTAVTRGKEGILPVKIRHMIVEPEPELQESPDGLLAQQPDRN